MRKNIAAVFGLIFLLSIAAGSARAQTAVGKPAPDVSAADASGAVVKLSDFKGKVVLVNIWASWCGPCVMEFPKLNELAGRLQGADAVVLGVNIDDKKENARKFLARFGAINVRVVYDEKKSVPKALQAEAMPTSVIVDKQGLVRYINSGYNPGDEIKMENLMKDLLK